MRHASGTAVPAGTSTYYAREKTPFSRAPIVAVPAGTAVPRVQGHHCTRRNCSATTCRCPICSCDDCTIRHLIVTFDATETDG